MTMQQRATLDDVARLAGVSRKTASRAYSQPNKVAPTTLEAILSAAKRLHFRPNTLARSLRRGSSSSTVGFVIGDLDNPFYYAIASGIEQVLSDHGLTMLVASTHDSEEGEERVADSLLSQRVAALLLIPVGDNHSYLDGERQLGTPIIAIDRPVQNLVADEVLLQNRKGARDAVRALIRAGHRRIAYLCHPASVYTQDERLLGYRQALAEAGIAQDPSLERLSDDPAVLPEVMVRQVLDEQDAPSALVAGNNRMSLGILRVTWDQPQRPGLVGFDDFDTADMLGVSVVAHDPMDMGRRAGELTLDRLTAPLARPTTLELPTTLRLRGSENLGL